MSIATQWAATRKEKISALYLDPTTAAREQAIREASDMGAFGARTVHAPFGTDLQAFQRDVERQRAIARECRKRDALPWCDREEETLP